jgi:hypothetical protein
VYTLGIRFWYTVIFVRLEMGESAQLSFVPKNLFDLLFFTLYSSDLCH